MKPVEIQRALIRAGENLGPPAPMASGAARAIGGQSSIDIGSGEIDEMFRQAPGEAF